MSASRPDTESLRPLMRPSSIAVIGASAEAGKIGAIPLRYLAQYGYRGAVYPINPRGGEIQGLPAFRSIGEAPGTVDLAVFAIPAARVVAALRECADAGVRTAVMFSAGFAEVGPEGAAAQAEITEIARAAGMRVVGPNCLGVANLSIGMVASFTPQFAEGMRTDGAIGLVSQSGAFGGYAAVMAYDRGLSFSQWLTTGNEADVELADGVAVLAEDPATKVILAYLEGVRDGARFLAALEAARRAGKPVVVLKCGRTEVGAEAAASHTASLAGSDEVYDAVFRQMGVYRAENLEELFDVGYAVSKGRLPASARCGIVTVSGGVGVMMADEAMRRGLDLPPMPAAAQAALKAVVPFAGTRNPVDVTGQVVSNMALFDQAVTSVLEDGGYDSIACFQTGAGRSRVLGPRIASVWEDMRRRYPDLPIAIAGSNNPEVEARLDAAGCLLFGEPTRAVRALAVTAWLRRELERPVPPPPPAVATVPLPAGRASELEALAVLRAAGLPTVPARLVTSPAEARAAADAAGYPVVVKVVSADVPHKSDVGGVVLGLADGDAVERAYLAILRRVEAAVPRADIAGCLVAPMVPDGVETILGVHHDPVFGPVVMFGLGGVLVEVLRDVTFRVAPFGIDEAHRMIDGIAGRAVLDGVRGRPAADVDALAEALSRLSAFAAAHADAIASLDVNPFLVRPRGQGAVAVDAILVARGERAP